MTLRDQIRIGSGNLRRLKLRSFLTISGIVIAIGALVTMLSFASGNQRLVEDQFEDLDLLSTLVVYPVASKSDSSSVPLNEAAIEGLREIPGVRLAFPYEDFEVVVEWGEKRVTSSAQALPPSAIENRLFNRLLAGEGLAPDDRVGALVAESFLEELGWEEPEEALGETIRVAVRSASADSGVARVVESLEDRWNERLRALEREGTWSRAEWEAVARAEASDAARRFLEGFLNAQAETADTLEIRGVLRDGGRRVRLAPVVVPVTTARRFAQAGPGGDPTKLISAALSGRLFGGGDEGDPTPSYSQVTLIVDPMSSHEAIVDSVEAHGFRAFSFMAEFREMRRAFLYFRLGLAAVGLVALATAALGIVNTMLMSISERRREIGILKSLGAEARDIRRLFVVESGLIGMIGSIFGLLLGWIVARGGSIVAKEIMRREEMPPVEIFATPPWLVLAAIGFGTLVAVVAGWVPAARASRVDPVRALRNE